MTTIRRMSLNHHTGFDCGSALWFQNLTELPNGIYGPIFPVLIAGLHYTNIQILFRNSSVGKMTGVLSLLAKAGTHHVSSIVVLGQTMLQKGMLTEATEYFECAISKLFVAGLSTKDEEVDLLIISSSWAGVACIRQERFEEGLEHL